jgi:hypothetical protein
MFGNPKGEVIHCSKCGGSKYEFMRIANSIKAQTNF